MANEPDNLVLMHVREMRAKIDKIDAKIDKIDKDNETFKFQLTHTFGLAGMANLSAQLAQEKADDAQEQNKRRDAQFAEIERRMRQLEHTDGV